MVELQSEVAENRTVQVKCKHIKIVLKYSPLLKIHSYFLPLY